LVWNDDIVSTAIRNRRRIDGEQRATPTAVRYDYRASASAALDVETFDAYSTEVVIRLIFEACRTGP